MSKLNEFRVLLDDIDNQILELLEKRMNITKDIGKYKLENHLLIENKNREKEILLKTLNYKYQDKLEDIYKLIMTKSKEIQKYDYFLVGKSLIYSFSPLIYRLFGLKNYNLYETDSFNDVLSYSFSGINITNPFKEDAYKRCNELSEEAIKTHTVNTIIKSDNKFYGYNTDYFGFLNLLHHYEIDVENKNVIIIGNGATSRTIKAVLKELNVKNVIHLVRNIRSCDDFLISDYRNFLDYDYIINATNYGTYPNIELNPLFPLNEFKNLKAVIDVIYNPSCTPLINEANKYQIKGINGLYMLVSQAALNLNLYLNQDYKPLIDVVYHKLKFLLTNIVLIGMPFSGKSTTGKNISFNLNRKFIDIDQELEKQGNDLPTVLKNHPIEYFRAKETEETIKYAKESGLVISTGGGIVLSLLSMQYLKNNGIIIFLDVTIDTLSKRIDLTRPLVKSKEDLENLYNQRINLYRKYADIIIKEDEDVMEKIYEYFNN